MDHVLKTHNTSFQVQQVTVLGRLMRLKRKIIFTLISYYFCSSKPGLKLDSTIFVIRNHSVDWTIPDPIQRSIFLCGIGNVHNKVACIGIEGAETDTPTKPNTPKSQVRNFYIISKGLRIENGLEDGICIIYIKLYKKKKDQKVGCRPN